MSYFIYADIISSLLDIRLVDPGSTLIQVGAYDPKSSEKSLKVAALRNLMIFHFS